MKKLLAFAVFMLLAAPPVWADLDVTVRRGSVAPQPIAIVPFASAQGGPSTDVAQVVDDDLAHSGLFTTLPRSNMLERPSQPDKIDFRNWQVVKQNDVVIGQMIPAAQGGWTARFWLFDVWKGTQLRAFDMPPADESLLRRRGHQIADIIYEQLTGHRGYFDTYIAYVKGHGYGEARHFELVRADSDGKNETVIARSNEPLMSPSWSPDHSKLAFVGFRRGKSAIYIEDVATAHLDNVMQEPGINGAPVWSPDGRSLAVCLSYGFNPDIYIIDVATRQKRRMTTNPAIDTEPSWSPDGRTLAFTSDRGGSPQVYLMPSNYPDAEPKRLTFQGRQNLRPRYSPDGKSLAVVNQDGGKYRIAVIDLATQQMTVLTHGSVDESPDWAANSQALIYARNTNRGTELATVSKDGQIDRSLGAPGDVQEPAWSSFLDPDPMQ